MKKKNFESKLSKKAWCCGTSFKWKSVTLLKFPFKTWCVVNRMFQNLTRCKIADTKNDELCKDHQKIVPFWKTWFESDSLLKTGFKIWFFSKTLIGKLFFSFSQNYCWFLRKRIAANLAFFRVKRSKKNFLREELLSKSVFLQRIFASKTVAL